MTGRTRVTMEEVAHAIDQRMRQRREAVRQMLVEKDRADLLAKYDQDLRDNDLGVSAARSVWHSISDAQRRVLVGMRTGRRCLRQTIKPCVYVIDGPGSVGHIRLATMRNLSARGLVHVAGSAFDPESDFVLTEHGRFVLSHGEPKP